MKTIRALLREARDDAWFDLRRAYDDSFWLKNSMKRKDREICNSWTIQFTLEIIVFCK